MIQCSEIIALFLYEYIVLTLLQCDITLGEYDNVTQPLMNVDNVT